jgi:hypothetical protein
MLSTQTLTPASLSPEKPLLKTLRAITGFMLGIQGVLFFFASCIFGGFSLFIGGLAFLAGAGNATDDQLKASGLMLAFMIVYPFVWSLMLVLSSINILQRKRPTLIIILCLLSVLNDIVLLIYMIEGPIQLQLLVSLDKDAGWKLFAFITMLTPLASVIIAFSTKGRVAVIR